MYKSPWKIFKSLAQHFEKWEKIDTSFLGEAKLAAGYRFTLTQQLAMRVVSYGEL